MAQRTVIAILGTVCLALLAYLLATTYLGGPKPSGEWERATEAYAQEYQQWLSTTPASGWARVQALATGPEWERIEKLKPTRKEPSPWGYGGGTYRLVTQFHGQALVQASYTLQRGQDKRPVEEVYLLSNTIRGIKVMQLVAGTCQP